MDMEASGTFYDVFLSFRGPDTRQGFTDVLYDHMDKAGIRVFRDDDELAIGDKIEMILDALRRSQVCVPIFSVTFAESKWCLREVRNMIELDKVVVPIFYGVEPCDVKLKTPAYSKFMEKHETIYGKNRVDEWKDALKAIAKFKGREVSQTSYTKFCKRFVEELLIKLKPRKRYDLDYLVGIDDQLNYAIELLDVGAADVRYILIHGMGGIGKTTLAKVIFNKLLASFDSCIFLENVRESYSRPLGLTYLQTKLGNSVDPKSAAKSNMSCRDTREKLRGKKVLIILDDVHTGEQIKKLVRKSWCASGSRIIVTTRNKDVLNECEDLDDDSVQSLEMGMLKDDEALKLFARRAFRQDSPPNVYKSLAKEVISTTGGLPLALKVFSSLLRGKDERVWRDVIARSAKVPPKEVRDRLKITYEALEHEQQQIFLDIACFFIGMEKTIPCYMWEACQLYPTYGLQVLVSMSLVKITDENKIWMHDQLRDLGRDIARGKNPLKQSRIWLQEDTSRVLMGKEGTNMVEALSLREPLGITLTDERCANFENIRFLQLVGAKTEGKSEGLLTKLTWLSWHFCPLDFEISRFCVKKLVILDLSHSYIDENWSGWRLVQMASTLKVLDLKSCHNLTRTPYFFTENHTLEMLILSQCSRLISIDSSIGNLKSLKVLDARGCHLRGLPVELSTLECLEEVHVTGQNGILNWTEYTSHQKTLVSLTLEDFQISATLGSFAGLVKLKNLSLGRILTLSKLPESLGGLESLVKLDLSHCYQLRELPNSIGGLAQLRELSILSCYGIEKLPDSLLNLTSLVSLNLSWTNVCTLPASIGVLQELQVLRLSGCKIKMLPASIGRLKKLEDLDASHCGFLSEIPLEIGGLSSLRRLSLTGSNICTLPSTIHQLSLLQSLYIDECDGLGELPELPPGLTNLNVSSSCLRKVHYDLSRLDSISNLVLTKIDDLGIIQKLPKKPKNMKVNLSNATSPFNLSSMTQLESLRLFIKNAHSSWVYGQIKFPNLSNLRNLSSAEFEDILTEDGLESLRLRELDNLKTIWISSCSSKLIEVCLAKNLTSLTIRDCRELKGLPNLSHLKALSELFVSACPKLSQILGLEELESLNYLEIHDCMMERLGNLSKLKQLQHVIISWCPELTHIEGIEGLFLKHLSIKHCERLSRKANEMR